MLKPINNHILIEPIPHTEFISSLKETYEEIGLVIDADPNIPLALKAGDKVYFDAYLAAKFPKTEDTYYWLVKYEDVRAVDFQE